MAHRRAGKTVACVNDLIRRAIADGKENARYAYLAPFYSQAKAVAWDYVLRFAAPIIAKTWASELQVELINGARIRLYGADNPDALRGIYLDGVVLDEYADMRPRVWGEIIRPLLADRKGWATFIGTPKGKNEFWQVFTAAERAPDWFALSLKASMSGLLDPQELADARRGMTEDQFAQEFECSFDAAILGAYYGREMRLAQEQGRIAQVDHDPALKTFTAWDLGYTDDTAIWWFQVTRGEIHVIDHYAASGLAFDDYAQAVIEKPYKYAMHYLPHDARAKTLASGGRSIQEMAWKAFGAASVRIVPELSVQDGIQAARAMLPHTWFDESRCAEGIEALRQYQREWDDEKKAFRERPRHDWTSHTADAFRMMAVAWREEMAPAEKQPPKFRNPQDMTLDELWKTARPQPTRI